MDVLCLRDFKYYLCNLVVGQKTLPILGDIFAWYRAFPEKRSLNIKKLLYLAHIDTDSLQEISEDDRKVFEGDQAFWSRVRSDVSSARQH